MPPTTNPKIVFAVIICITALSLVFGLVGGFLLYKGFQGGELFVGSAGTLSGSLAALLSSTRSSPPSEGAMTTSTTTTMTVKPDDAPTGPVEVTVTNPPSDPVPVQPTT